MSRTANLALRYARRLTSTRSCKRSLAGCPLLQAVTELGAVDVMSKPLSLLKLKTLWQHTVSNTRSCLQLPATGHII